MRMMSVLSFFIKKYFFIILLSTGQNSSSLSLDQTQYIPL